MAQPNQRHIVVAGNLSAEELYGFITEFYHPNHQGSIMTQGTHPTVIVFLSPLDPTPAMEAILQSPGLPPNTIKFLKGSLTDEQSLERAQLTDAKAVFLLVDNFAPVEKDVDAENILALIVMLRYLMSAGQYQHSEASGMGEMTEPKAGGKIRCFMQLMNTSNEHRVEALPFHHLRCVVGIHSLKMRILGFGCCHPGGLAILHNLTRSFSFTEDRRAPISINGDFDSYVQGMDNEIYRVAFDKKVGMQGGYMQGRSYSEAVKLLYANFGVLLIGIEKTVDSEDGPSSIELELFPSPDWSIGSSGSLESGYILAPSQEVAEDIERWNPQDGFPPSSPLSSQNPMDGATNRLQFTASAPIAPGETVRVAEKVEMSVLNEELESIRLMMVNSCEPGPSSPHNLLSGYTSTHGHSTSAVAATLPAHHVANLTPMNSDLILGAQDSPMFTALSGKLMPGYSLEGHILICGPLNDLAILVHSIRQDPVRSNQQIIVLNATHAQEDKIRIEGIFHNLHVMHGVCTNEADLERAGFAKADRVIVLSNHVSDRSTDSSASETQTGVSLDDAAVLVSMSPSGDHCPLLTYELVEANNGKYLHPLESISNDLRHEYSLWSHFAAGRIWPASALDSLICQAYYDQALLVVLEALLPRHDEVSSEARRCTIWQIPLPRCLVGKSFQCALESMVNAEQSLQVIGLYRNSARDLFSYKKETGTETTCESASGSAKKTHKRRNSRSHFVMERTTSGLTDIEHPAPLYTPSGAMGGITTEMDSHTKPSNSTSPTSPTHPETGWETACPCAIVCPRPEFELRESDILFVLGDKPMFLEKQMAASRVNLRHSM